MRGDLPLPLVCLLREPGADGFLSRLDQLLDTEVEQTPHVLIDVAAPGEYPEAVLPLLHALHGKLHDRQFGQHGSLKRFDNYELAHHLTGKELPLRQAKRDAPIRKVLREWGLGSRISAEATEMADRVGGRTQTAVGVLKLAGYLVGLYWGRDRVPGLFRERRWFMRQPYMVPKHSPGFLRFAERLTKNRYSAENPEQVHKLLVHAFLEDLRIAYRRTRLRFLPHRQAWRRTAYVTVLLDNVHENGGWELLRLINEVRNETGELDPLLIIAAGDEPPPGIPAEPRRSNEPTVAEKALEEWKDRLPRRRQLLAADARYLFVKLPKPVQSTELADADDADAWDSAPDDRPRAAPWPARRGVGELIAAVLLLAALTPTSVAVAKYGNADCAFFHAASSGIATEVMLIEGDDQCVGYSDNDGQVFGSNERLRNAQKLVFAQNELAEQLHHDLPERPYFSLIYFAGLTSNASTPTAEHAVAEEIEGLVIRQGEQNTETSKDAPLLRIIIANGGTAMKAAPEVVRDALVPLLESDPSIMGVVGLDRSVPETLEAITELGGHGVTTLGTTLTSVGLGDRSPLYFQLVPDNNRQAALVSEYAKQVGATKVTIYRPPGDNTYVDTLVKVMEKALAGGAVETIEWKTSAGELTPPCDAKADRGNEIAFYAGREVDFGDFLRVMQKNCSESTRPPRIVADDAVSRWVAHAPGRNVNTFSGATVSYVGMGGPVVLAGTECVNGKTDSLPGATAALRAFCAGYHQLREELKALPTEDRPIQSWPGERVGGLYDAAGLFVEAVQQLHRLTKGTTPHRAAVASRFRDMNFEGATGPISFAESRIGNNRSLAILTISNVHDVESVPVCERMIGISGTGNKQSNGCPPKPR